MFSYPDISRWLTFPIDPITVEDWLANRLHFGEVEKPTVQDKELETAYQIESLRQNQNSSRDNLSLEVLLSGLDTGGSQKLKEDIWVVAPVGKVPLREKVAVEVEVTSGAQKEKIQIPPVEVKSIALDPTLNYKIKINLRGELKLDKRNNSTFEITGCRKMVVDSRGRPMVFLDLATTREKMVRWKGELHEDH